MMISHGHGPGKEAHVDVVDVDDIDFSDKDKPKRQLRREPKRKFFFDECTDENEETKNKEPFRVKSEPKERETKSSDLIGSVVWAKVAGFPYWPCFVCDPSEDIFQSSDNEKIQKTARECINSNNLYMVYFYADPDLYAGVQSSQIKMYRKNKDTFSKVVRKASGLYKKFQRAMKLADKETCVPKPERLKWILYDMKNSTAKQLQTVSVSPLPSAIGPLVSVWESRLLLLEQRAGSYSYYNSNKNMSTYARELLLKMESTTCCECKKDSEEDSENECMYWCCRSDSDDSS